MYQIEVRNFDIEKICYSGQCFRMKYNKRGGFELIAYGTYLEIYQRGNQLLLSCTKEEYDQLWKSYLGLEEDYVAMAHLLDEKDTYMKKAMAYGAGIRILKQDVWEMIVSFLISQQNNIPRIKKCIQAICEQYGEEKKNSYGETYYAFPTAKAFAALQENDLMACNLGYRSKYVVRTAKSVVDGCFDLNNIQLLSYEEAKAELLKLYGVGIKVAECICLYGLHHLNAFPVDTHINQVLAQNYPDGFPFERYHGVAGVFQQYAFYYDLYKKNV